MRICGIDIYKVGKNLPCMNAADVLGQIQYNKTSADRKVNDYALVNVGPTCPVNRPDSKTADNQFRAQIVFEMPLTTAAVEADSKVKVSGGIRFDDSPVFVSTGEFDLSDTVYTGEVKSVSGTIAPFFTDYPDVTYKDRPLGTAAIQKGETFFIKYILKPQPLSTGRYLVTFVPGENFKVW